VARTILRVEDLWKIYGSAEAVKGISFAVETGEFFGLLGPNGAGKTSTIGMITGWVTPSRGRVEIGGVDLSGRAREAKKWVGLVPQNFAFYPRLTAEENLSFFGSLYGVQGGTLKERTARVLEMVSLTGRAGQRVETFSGGMKRRLNIAIGLIHDPAILILDEPTVGIDAQSRSAILASLKKLNRDGMTMLFTTHYIEEAEYLCDRVAVMDRGRIIALGTPDRLIDEHVPYSVITFRLTPPLDLEAVRGIHGVESAAAENGSYRVTTPVPQETLIGIVAAAHEHGVKAEDINMKRASLEDVFLKITGRRIRD